MNEEQLLQEARIEAEKFYPFKSDWSSHNDTIDFNQDRRLAYVQGYIANAKKQMSEAVEFFEWMKASKYIKYESGYRHFLDGIHGKLFTINELYALFLQQQKQE